MWRKPKHVIQGDERCDCLSYYEQEKTLRLLYERVEQLFDKALAKYEDEYFRARKQGREFWSSMEKIHEVREYFSHAATEIVTRKKTMSPAPDAASAMSAAWEAAYLSYQANRDVSNFVLSSNAMEVAMQRQRAKDLYANLKQSLQKAWKEENELRKLLKLNSSEHQDIVDNAMRSMANDAWLRRLESECP